jgi:hypothetical protein
MRWLKRYLWKAGIAIAGILFLLVLMTWLPASVAGAYERAPGFSGPGTVTVQTTPTVDATVTALTKEQLTQEVAQQQHTWENWLWSNAATILSSFLSTLVIVLGALFGLWRWRSDRRDAQDKELKDRQNEREKRDEDRLQKAVEGLGSGRLGAKLGAAVMLRTFLLPNYPRVAQRDEGKQADEKHLPVEESYSGELEQIRAFHRPVRECCSDIGWPNSPQSRHHKTSLHMPCRISA